MSKSIVHKPLEAGDQLTSSNEFWSNQFNSPTALGGFINVDNRGRLDLWTSVNLQFNKRLEKKIVYSVIAYSRHNLEKNIIRNIETMHKTMTNAPTSWTYFPSEIESCLWFKGPTFYVIIGFAFASQFWHHWLMVSWSWDDGWQLLSNIIKKGKLLDTTAVNTSILFISHWVHQCCVANNLTNASNPLMLISYTFYRNLNNITVKSVKAVYNIS